MSMRQSCPHPYADADDNVEIVCEASPWVTQVRGVVFKHHVENLLPYTNYQYQLNAFNEAGGLVAPPVVTVPTSTARKLSSHMSSCHGLHMSRYYVILAVNMASVADMALNHHPLTEWSNTVKYFCVFLFDLRNHLTSCVLQLQGTTRSTLPVSHRQGTFSSSTGPTHSQSTEKFVNSRYSRTELWSTVGSRPYTGCSGIPSLKVRRTDTNVFKSFDLFYMSPIKGINLEKNLFNFFSCFCDDPLKT